MALMMSLDVWHPEIETFIKIKEDLNKINKANLSVEVDDSFMKIITTMNKVPGFEVTHSRILSNGVEHISHPQTIFDIICESAWKSAEPGILFINKLRNYNLMEFVDDYEIETTNPCGRWPQVKNWAKTVKSKSFFKI